MQHLMVKDMLSNGIEVAVRMRIEFAEAAGKDLGGAGQRGLPKGDLPTKNVQIPGVSSGSKHEMLFSAGPLAGKGISAPPSPAASHGSNDALAPEEKKFKLAMICGPGSAWKS